MGSEERGTGTSMSHISTTESEKQDTVKMVSSSLPWILPDLIHWRAQLEEGVEGGEATPTRSTSLGTLLVSVSLD